MILHTVNTTLLKTTMPHYLTSQHLRPLPYHTQLYCHHYTTIQQLLCISQCLSLSVTPLPSCFPQYHFLLSLVNLSHDSYHYHYHEQHCLNYHCHHYYSHHHHLRSQTKCKHIHLKSMNSWLQMLLRKLSPQSARPNTQLTSCTVPKVAIVNIITIRHYEYL